MTNNDIYSRLLAGETMEDIMSDLTAQANEAQARYDEFQKLEAERKLREEAERESKIAAKRDKLYDIIRHTLYFCAEFYPSFGITKEEVDSMEDTAIDVLVDLTIGLLDIEEVRANGKGKATMRVKLPFAGAGLRSKANTMDEAIKPCDLPNNGIVVESAKKEPTTDDIFAQFFKGFPFS